jgi:hypothetical protein
MVVFIVYNRPTKFIYESSSTLVSSYHDIYSPYWCYNVAAFVYMSYLIIWVIKNRSKGVIATYTVISWNLNTIGHGINAMAPFLCDHHILLHVNRMIRFPALVSASITTSVWNFILLPYIHFFVLDTEEKRHNFTKWNLSFRLVQKHVCNIIYAFLNTILSKRLGSNLLFDDDDLWYGLFLGLGYGLFYNLILDRIGVHIYPIFSPRSNLVVLTWTLVFGIYFAFHWFWNLIISNYLDLLSLPLLLGTNILLTVACLIMAQFLSNNRIATKTKTK